MPNRSNRQFRSYVIRWFLIVVGMLVGLGGGFIYISADNYLSASFKRDNQALLNAAAALLQTESQLNAITAASPSDKDFRQITQSLESLTDSDTSDRHFFLLRYDTIRKRFFFLADPQKAAKDSLQVRFETEELLIQYEASGYPAIIFPANIKTLSQQSGRRVISLTRGQHESQLLLDGHKILTVPHRNQLTASYNNVQLDKAHRQTQVTAIRLNEIDLKLKYRFIPQGQLLHPSGSEFIAAQKITSGMRSLFSAQTNSELESLSNIYLLAEVNTKKSRYKSLLVARIPKQQLQQIHIKLLESMVLWACFLVIFVILSAIFFSRKITDPLEQLSQAMARLIDNDFNFKLSTRKFASFGFLAKQFNQMLIRLESSRSDLIHLNKSYSRFVPHQLLKQLSGEGVRDIALGDNCERQMTVLFCDIRGFTALSESMTPSENFRFINHYLSLIAPVINKHGGIIDKYLGDGLMALFPDEADAALKAAISMLAALDEYNQSLVQKRLPTIEIGLGLHSGNTMLGTVGTASRMDATVISDTVNAAARIEAMTKVFHTKILISEATKRLLEDHTQFRIRYIATCQMRGKVKPVALYEVYNNDPLSLQREKSHNQAAMIQAWQIFRDGDSTQAIHLYQKIFEKNPHDKSVFALIEYCQSRTNQTSS